MSSIERVREPGAHLSHPIYLVPIPEFRRISGLVLLDRVISEMTTLEQSGGIGFCAGMGLWINDGREESDPRIIFPDEIPFFRFYYKQQQSIQSPRAILFSDEFYSCQAVVAQGAERLDFRHNSGSQPEDAGAFIKACRSENGSLNSLVVASDTLSLTKVQGVMDDVAYTDYYRVSLPGPKASFRFWGYKDHEQFYWRVTSTYGDLLPVSLYTGGC